MKSKDSEEARHLRALARQIHSGNCVLVLGPGASTDIQGGREIPLNNLLARELSAEPQIKHMHITDLDCNDLRHVSQVLYDLERRSSVLQERIIDFYGQFSDRTSEFHRNIAALPFQLCITTTPDDFLYNAFVHCEDTKKTPVRRFYNFRSEQLDDLPKPSVNAPLVYHLYGYPDEPRSLVITENDLIDFLTKVIKNEPRLQDTIRSKLSRKETTFLFIDLGFKNWYLRALLWALGLYGHDEISMAIEDPEFFAQSQRHQTTVYYSVSKMIEFQQESLDEFAQKLRKAYYALVEHTSKTIPQVPKGAPCVFISYANENQDEVGYLEEKLMEANIAVWRDKQNLRVGDDWKLVLKHVIHNIVDYFVVLQTEEMMRRTKGIFMNEITEALECQKSMLGLRFVLPVKIGETEDMHLLKHLHSNRVDTEEGFNALTKAIMEDWKERKLRKTKE